MAEQLGVERDKAWPKSARWLWKRIKEVLPLLVTAGIDAKAAKHAASEVTDNTDIRNGNSWQGGPMRHYRRGGAA